MSKKKVRKPKKKNNQRKKNHPPKKQVEIETVEEIILEDPITHERTNVSELIRNDDGITTSIHDLQVIYDAYSRPDSPIRDEKKAFKILKRLADLGDMRACGVYGGTLLENGQEKVALPYIKKAAAANDFSGLFNYGLYYYNHKKYQKAFDYFCKVSDLGNDEDAAFNAFIIAQNNLEDSKNAQKWFNQAAKLGSEDAKKDLWYFNLKQPFDHRDEQVALQALKDDLASSDQKTTRELFYELAYTYVVTEMSEHQFFEMLSKLKDDIDDVIYAKAECYAFGIGTKPDAQKAKDYYEKEAYDRLGQMYCKYVDLNDPLSAFMKRGKNNKACAYFAGKMLYNGTYGKRDVDLAVKYLKKSQSVTYPRTISALAHIYFYDEKYEDVDLGLEILEDYDHYRLYGRDIENLKDLYSLYHYGLGVDVDEEKALSFTQYLGFYRL